MRLNAKRLLEIMEAKGLTMEDIASRTGLTLESVDWIIREQELSISAHERIASAAGVPVAEIARPDYTGFMENVIEFLKDDTRATLSLSQKRYISQVRKLSEQYPDECEIVANNKDGSICAHVPVSWVQIRRPREYSEEQRAKMAERLEMLRKSSSMGVK